MRLWGGIFISISGPSYEDPGKSLTASSSLDLLGDQFLLHILWKKYVRQQVSNSRPLKQHVQWGMKLQNGQQTWILLMQFWCIRRHARLFSSQWPRLSNQQPLPVGPQITPKSSSVINSTLSVCCMPEKNTKHVWSFLCGTVFGTNSYFEHFMSVTIGKSHSKFWGNNLTTKVLKSLGLLLFLRLPHS